MDNPLISVIIPVYNVEKYLDRCVSSVVNQTYAQLEIILVDDGSPDNCPAMCDAWAEKDRRIQVIHKKNGGLSDARNAGMRAATGKYMAFLDSDDYIALEMYQLLLEQMHTDDSDIAACGVEMVFEDGSAPRKLTRDGKCLLNRAEAMEAVIRESWLKPPVWGKLYKSDLIRDIPFPVGKYHEDVFWSYQAVARAEKVSVIDTPCYFYIQRSGSIMDESYSLHRLDVIVAKQQRVRFIQTAFPELTGLAVRDLLFSCIYHGQLAIKALPKEQLGQVMDRLKKAGDTFTLSELDGLTFTHKCWLWLAKINLPITCRIRNLLGIGM